PAPLRRRSACREPSRGAARLPRTGGGGRIDPAAAPPGRRAAALPTRAVGGDGFGVALLAAGRRARPADAAFAFRRRVRSRVGLVARRGTRGTLLGKAVGPGVARDRNRSSLRTRRCPVGAPARGVHDLRLPDARAPAPRRAARGAGRRRSGRARPRIAAASVPRPVLPP